MRAGESEEEIAGLGERPRDSTCSAEWDFHRTFAAACIADGDICIAVEERRAESLVDVGNGGESLSLVERLLVAADCE